MAALKALLTFHGPALLTRCTQRSAAHQGIQGDKERAQGKGEEELGDNGRQRSGNMIKEEVYSGGPHNSSPVMAIVALHNGGIANGSAGHVMCAQQRLRSVVQLVNVCG